MRTEIEKTEIYDMSKVITALLVVFAHAARMYTPLGVYKPINESVLVSGIHDFIYAYHMPFFIFLSGCVYGYCIRTGKYKDNRKFVVDKAKKLLLPYLIIGLFYVAPAMVGLRLAGTDYWAYVWKGIVLSVNARHLWYIFALFWIFLLAIPLKRFMLKGIRGSVILVGISTVLFVLTRLVPDYFQLKAALEYQIYFFLGTVFDFLYPKIELFYKKNRIIGLLFLLLTLVRVVYNPNSLTKHAYRMTGICMMLALVWEILHRYPNIMKTTAYFCLRKNSFGIYLFHPILIYFLFACLKDCDVAPLFLICAVSIVSTVVSLAITKLLRRLRLTVVIGE